MFLESQCLRQKSLSETAGVASSHRHLCVIHRWRGDDAKVSQFAEIK